jgi:hypothetical protein
MIHYEGVESGKHSMALYVSGVVVETRRALSGIDKEQHTMADDDKISKSDLLDDIDAGWQQLNGYLSSLSEDDFLTNHDAAGWAVKDHLIHIAVWEDGVWALLEGKSRYAQMGLDKTTWDGHDYDHINDVIFRLHRNTSLSEVRRQLNAVHVRFIAKIYSLTDADLYQPYGYYQPEYADWQDPVVGWIINNSYRHYREHIPWMAAIVVGE